MRVLKLQQMDVDGMRMSEEFVGYHEILSSDI